LISAKAEMISSVLEILGNVNFLLPLLCLVMGRIAETEARLCPWKIKRKRSPGIYGHPAIQKMCFCS